MQYINDSITQKHPVVEKTDRLYRNFSDYVAIDGLDAAIHLVKENSVLSKESKSSEKFVHGIKVLMAKNYIDNLSEECRKGMNEKASQGIWPSYAPVGYINSVRSDRKRVIEPDPALGPIVTQIFTIFASGKHTVREIALIARKLGFGSRGARYAYGPSSLNRILRNPIYKGDVVWRGITYPGIHTPLVTRESWSKVQDILDNRRIQKGRRSRRDFLFARMITCDYCGGLITGQEQKGHVYYHCSGYHGPCPQRYVREEVIDTEVRRVLGSLEGSEAYLGWITRCLEKRQREWRATHEQALALAKKAQESASRKMDQLYEDRLAGKVPDWFYDKKAAEISAELAECIARVQSLESDGPVDSERVARTFELAKKASTSYSALRQPEKRNIAETLLSNCRWRDDRLSGSLRQPFGFIADAIRQLPKAEPGSEAEMSLLSNWRSGRDLPGRTCHAST